MGDRICSVGGCGKAVDSRGWCKAHYRRWQRHGDPLGGTASKGALMQWVMEVALTYEGDECLTWPFGRDGNGRGSMHVNGKHIRASRFICKMAHGEPETPELDAAHSCGNGHLGCVAKKHLRWATVSENMADSFEHGTFAMGEKSPHAKLTQLDVQMIRALVGNGFSQKAIAKRFGISPAQVGKIALRQKWSQLGDFESSTPQPNSLGLAGEGNSDSLLGGRERGGGQTDQLEASRFSLTHSAGGAE